METQVLDEGGANLLLNALLQNDMDAAGFKILNLDTSNLNVGAGPISFPAVAGQFLNSYDSVSRLFTALQPATTDLSDFPDVAGQAGKMLSNDGVLLLWATPQGTSGLGNNGYLNVKQAPYNAVGDGVTDDYAAISQALADAAGGLGIYFPKGTYLISQPLSATAPCSLLGDNPYQSVIRLDPAAAGGYVMQVPGNSNLTRLGFDGALNLGVQPVPVGRLGLQILNAGGVSLQSCAVSNCSGSGIQATGCFAILIRDCLVANCGGYGIQANNSPKSVIMGNRVQGTTLSGIWAVNAPYCTINNNQVYQCGPNGYGIGAFDSDNSVLSGNIVQQCLIGMVVAVTGSHSANRLSFGYTVNGNNTLRNYLGGIVVILASGTNLTGNIVSATGHGGTDGLTYTVEPGVMVDTAGSAYQAGDVLTLSGGTGTPTQVAVTATGPGGSLLPDGLAIIEPGKYSVFPANPASCTGGSGSGALLILTGTSIINPGTAYSTGQVLIATTGSFFNPVRVLVTAVDPDGRVTAYQILDGGGYFGTLPATLSFGNDASAGSGGILLPTDPDVVRPGTSLQLTPSWGLRYSKNMLGKASFGIATVGALQGGVISGNMIDTIKTGTGIVIREDVSPYDGRADWLCVTGNSVMNNAYAIKGATGSTLDDNYLFNSIFDNNLIYPPLPVDVLT
jgi:parallel beta-helix repeat protein